jgi:hypothetical protein
MTQQKEKYETEVVYYSANTSNGVIQSSEAFFHQFDRQNTLVTALSLAGDKVYLSDFSDIRLASGKVPQDAQHYISSRVDKKAVGQLKKDLMTSQYEKLYGFPSRAEVRVVDIAFKKPLSSQNKRYLLDNGFIKIDATNVNQKINAGFYSFLIFLIQILAVMLFFVLLVFWSVFLLKYFTENQKKTELLQSFGANKLEIIRTYLWINKNQFKHTFVELLVGLLVVTAVNAYLFQQNSLGQALGVLCFAQLFVIVSFSLTLYLKLCVVKKRYLLSASLTLAIVCFVILIAKVQFWTLLVFVIGGVWYFVYQKNLKLKSVFKARILGLSVALSIILAIFSSIVMIF